MNEKAKKRDGPWVPIVVEPQHIPVIEVDEIGFDPGKSTSDRVMGRGGYLTYRQRAKLYSRD